MEGKRLDSHFHGNDRREGMGMTLVKQDFTGQAEETDGSDESDPYNSPSP